MTMSSPLRFIIILVIPFLFSPNRAASIHPDRRARVQSILVRTQPGEAFNETTTVIPQVAQADVDHIVVQVGRNPEGPMNELRQLYKESPKGLLPLLGFAFFYMIGCILIIKLWI